MVRILTDSAADFSEELARQLNVEVLPLGVTFEDGTAYRDRVDLQPEEFYEKLAACEKLPKTSQPNLGDVLTLLKTPGTQAMKWWPFSSQASSPAPTRAPAWPPTPWSTPAFMWWTA